MLVGSLAFLMFLSGIDLLCCFGLLAVNSVDCCYYVI